MEKSNARNDRKRTPFHARRGTVWLSKLKLTKPVLKNNDVSNDANSNRHTKVTGMTQDKAHGCLYMAPLNGTHLQKAGN